MNKQHILKSYQCNIHRIDIAKKWYIECPSCGFKLNDLILKFNKERCPNKKCRAIIKIKDYPKKFLKQSKKWRK